MWFSVRFVMRHRHWVSVFFAVELFPCDGNWQQTPTLPVLRNRWTLLDLCANRQQNHATTAVTWLQACAVQFNTGFLQCCSPGQNPKVKDEAKAMTLKAEAEAKAWTLEAKTKTKTWTLQGQGRGRGRGRGLDPRDKDQGQNCWVQGQFQDQIWLTM